MEANFIIRQERPADYAQVYDLVKASFTAAQTADGDEQDYLNELRKKDTFIPALSLVAEQSDGRIVGQIVLSETDITTKKGTRTALVLSPICVHPALFRQGIARAMVETGLAKARGMGYGAVFLCGDPAIYRRLGFVPSYKLHVYHVRGRRAKWSMARELTPGALKGLRGTVNTV